MSFISSLISKLTLKPQASLAERKSQYQQVLMDAMDDGVLTDDEIEELDDLRKELHLSEDDVKAIRMRAFQKAVSVVKADGLVTPKEERDLQKIKKYLNVGDDGVGKDRGTLAKMRVLYEIHRGNMPVDTIPGLGLDKSELCHVSVGADYFDPPQADETVMALGPRFAPGKPYQMGVGKLSPIPENDLYPGGKGAFTVTNQRLMFNSGSATFRIRFEKLEAVTIFNNGFAFLTDVGEPRVIKLSDIKDLEVIAAIISRYLTPPASRNQQDDQGGPGAGPAKRPPPARRQGQPPRRQPTHRT